MFFIGLLLLAEGSISVPLEPLGDRLPEDEHTGEVTTDLRSPRDLGGDLNELVDALYREEENRDEYGPLVHYDSEFIEDDVVIHVMKMMSRRYASTVFKTGDGKVIKYQANCADMADIHPLVRDYVFLKHIEELDISPKVEFLSLPIKFTFDPITDKTDFKMLQEERSECAANPDSSLRFMVMQAADMSVETCVRRLENRGISVTMRQAVNFMKATIEAIWKLHSKNIIHGDIHFGNIVFMPAESEGGSRRVGLIDFGTASFLSELELLADLTREPFTYNHCFQSHWNIAGYRFSFRDDIFKAILAGAMYLNGSDYARFCLAADIDTMYKFKSEGFLFNFPDHPDAIEAISASDPARESIRTHLSNVLRLIRAVDSLDARPPYREILDQLDQVLTFL